MDTKYLDDCEQELHGVGFTREQSKALIGIFCDMISEECSVEITTFKNELRKAEIKIDV